METNESRLKGMAEEVARCDKCRLCTTRTRTVFGEGNPDAEVLFIGEGPGKQEDITGRPFVGRAGELLTRIIELGMGVPRSEVYIANLVKCRPTVDMNLKRDRPPDPDELQACVPYLMAQVDIIRPRVIIALGSPSSKFLLATTSGITRIRGTWGEYRGIPVMPTYHPSYLLRNGGDASPLKREVWHDIKIVMERLGWPLPRIKRGEK